MQSPRNPDKRTVTFGVLITVCMMLLGWYYGARRVGRVSWPEEAALTLMQPLQSAVTNVGDSVGERWRSLRELGNLESENRQLRRRVAELESRNNLLERYFLENKRLRRMLELGPNVPDQAIAAEVISTSTSNWYRRVMINRGSRDGVHSGDVVTTEAGVVGQVLRVAHRSSSVVLLTDRDSGVGAMIMRSHAVGVCEGTGDKQLRLVYLSQDADVRIGDVVITSGHGEIFPRGKIIGKITRVTRDIHGSSQTALVDPAADFTRLEAVFVLKRTRSES